MRKKRSSLVGAFVSTHGKSIDDVDRSIVEARTSLNEVTQELQERVYRWKQMELLCGFSIINNPGLTYLESMLYRGMTNGRPTAGMRGRLRSSQDDLDDETGSIFSHSVSGASSSPPPAFHDHGGDQNGPGSLGHRTSNSGTASGIGSGHWGTKEAIGDSSGSEAGKEEIDDFPQESSTFGSNVQFTVGAMETLAWNQSIASCSAYFLDELQCFGSNVTFILNCSSWRDERVSRRGTMVRSYSQDTNISPLERDGSPPKSSQSESCLDSAQPVTHNTATLNSSVLTSNTPSSSTSTSSLSGLSKGTKETTPGLTTPAPLNTQKSAPQLPSVTMEEETYSTDSNSTMEEEARRKKRKIHFPTFTRKPKPKPS
ncbi:hypothetical protein J437_LFUL015722 [Ladona fulva]|uniref:STIM1/2 Orai1-activating region domain-containing protein n=1 Tax=Ladona fulva TaxID=123851 RepID=A0A8K0KIJ0_LADFU|nr:hypothetical protein J437_LFUL015722 [Ladona fulva]